MKFFSSFLTMSTNFMLKLIWETDIWKQVSFSLWECNNTFFSFLHMIRNFSKNVLYEILFVTNLQMYVAMMLVIVTVVCKFPDYSHLAYWHFLPLKKFPFYNPWSRVWIVLIYHALKSHSGVSLPLNSFTYQCVLKI